MSVLEKILQEIEKEAEKNPEIGRKQAEGMARAMDIIRKHLPENDGWIPVENGPLPEYEVMACDKYGEYMIGYMSSGSDGEGGNRYFCESDEAIMCDAIAWRLLPAPCKPEKGVK